VEKKRKVNRLAFFFGKESTPSSTCQVYFFLKLNLTGLRLRKLFKSFIAYKHKDTDDIKKSLTI